jgi:ATP-binding cassette subfamily F protein uup
MKRAGLWSASAKPPDCAGLKQARYEESRHSSDAKPIILDFSARVMRGDRIDGVGKNTLLRLLLGELARDSGEVLRGVNVQVAYEDRQREQLDPGANGIYDR